MGRLSPAITLLVSLALGASACDYISDINNQAYRAYHSSRWQATTRSCVSGEPYQAPAEPPVPRVCSPTVDNNYPVVALQYNSIALAWDRLVLQAEDNLAFSTEILEGLESRNTTSIEQLAPQISSYLENTSKIEADWRVTLEESAHAQKNLQAAWEEAWADNDLQFDLEQQVISKRLELANKTGELREETLAHYHQNEFSRMAESYLGFEIVGYEVPTESHLPGDCGEVAEAHRALNDALLIRYGIDKAIEQDMELISRLAKVDLSSQSWEDIQMRKGRYGEKRVSAAIARLKLLKYLDTLATDSLGIIIREVGLAWGEVWPGHTLETNIFEFAGVPKVDPGQ